MRFMPELQNTNACVEKYPSSEHRIEPAPCEDLRIENRIESR